MGGSLLEVMWNASGQALDFVGKEAKEDSSYYLLCHQISKCISKDLYNDWIGTVCCGFWIR